MFFLPFIDLNLLRILLFFAGGFLTMGYSSLNIEIMTSVFDVIIASNIDKTVIVKGIIYGLGFIDLIFALFLFNYLEKHLLLIFGLMLTNLAIVISLIQIYLSYQVLETTYYIPSIIITTLLGTLVIRLDSNQQLVYLHKLLVTDKNEIKMTSNELEKLVSINPATHKEVLEKYKGAAQKLWEKAQQEHIESKRKGIFTTITEFCYEHPILIIGTLAIIGGVIYYYNFTQNVTGFAKAQNATNQAVENTLQKIEEGNITNTTALEEIEKRIQTTNVRVDEIVTHVTTIVQKHEEVITHIQETETNYGTVINTMQKNEISLEKELTYLKETLKTGLQKVADTLTKIAEKVKTLENEVNNQNEIRTPFSMTPANERIKTIFTPESTQNVIPYNWGPGQPLVPTGLSSSSNNNNYNNNFTDSLLAEAYEKSDKYDLKNETTLNSMLNIGEYLINIAGFEILFIILLIPTCIKHKTNSKKIEILKGSTLTITQTGIGNNPSISRDDDEDDERRNPNKYFQNKGSHEIDDEKPKIIRLIDYSKKKKEEITNEGEENEMTTTTDIVANGIADLQNFISSIIAETRGIIPVSPITIPEQEVYNNLQLTIFNQILNMNRAPLFNQQANERLQTLIGEARVSTSNIRQANMNVSEQVTNTEQAVNTLAASSNTLPQLLQFINDHPYVSSSVVIGVFFLIYRAQQGNSTSIIMLPPTPSAPAPINYPFQMLPPTPPTIPIPPGRAITTIWDVIMEILRRR